MEGLFIAGAVVATLQFVRLQDRRLVPLAFFLAFLAGAEAREEWERSRRWFQLGAAAAGLALAVSTAARRPTGAGTSP
jgi:hypothetical protein